VNNSLTAKGIQGSQHIPPITPKSKWRLTVGVPVHVWMARPRQHGSQSGGGTPPQDNWDNPVSQPPPLPGLPANPVDTGGPIGSGRRGQPWPSRPQGGKNIALFGASIGRQCVENGLADELLIHLVPVLLGDGLRLFDNPGGEPIRLEKLSLGESGQVTDLRFGFTHGTDEDSAASQFQHWFRPVPALDVTVAAQQRRRRNNGGKARELTMTRAKPSWTAHRRDSHGHVSGFRCRALSRY
jgi:hypothetical protein